MKFCSKCGKELFDEAVVCPNCGCATEALKKEAGVSIAPQLRAYQDKVNAYFVRSIFALILAMGIGFIFMIINLVKKGSIEGTVLHPTIPSEIAEYESAKRKYRAGAVMTGISLMILGIAIFAGMMIGMFGAL